VVVNLTAVLALIPVRDGVLPAGGAEAASECGDRSLLVGSGVHEAALGLTGEVRCCEVGAFAPAGWSAALADLLADEAVVVLPASPDGRDLGPRLAAALDRPFLAGAVTVRADQVVMARDGGLAMHTVAAPPRFVATLQVGVRGVEPHHVPATVTDVALALPQVADPTLERIVEPDAATIDLAEAGRIVGGGAGLDGPERFAQLAQLGAAIGASVGATRVITDRGWIGHSRQIGTTGVVVDPQLYLAFGVSGAVQHTSGLGHPDHIVSVNTDAHCPMMQLADLAVVGDANAVLDALLEVLGG
jgi:electron transfer flavoprotein alpha subunit